MKSFVRMVLSIVALASATSAIAAGALPDGPYLIASGSAKTDVAPDYAVLTFTVESLAPTTAEASASVDKKVDSVFAVLKKTGIAEDDIRASTLNVSPSSDWDGNKRTYKGQSVSRNFRVTLHDLGKFSDLIQGLLDANVDEMGEVEFDSSHQVEIEKHNLDAAIVDARNQAGDMAAQAGEHVDRIYGMAPGEYSSFITQEFPFQGRYATAQLGNLEVTGSRFKRPEGYIIPKSITFSSSVTIICTVKQ